MLDFTFALLKCSDGGQTWANQPWQVNGFPVLVPVLQGEGISPSLFPLSQEPPGTPQILGCSSPLWGEGCSLLPEMDDLDNPKRCLLGNSELLKASGKNLLKQGHCALEISQKISTVLTEEKCKEKKKGSFKWKGKSEFCFWIFNIKLPLLWCI